VIKNLCVLRDFAVKMHFYVSYVSCAKLLYDYDCQNLPVLSELCVEKLCVLRDFAVKMHFSVVNSFTPRAAKIFVFLVSFV
jgi:hypothetical protein